MIYATLQDCVNDLEKNGHLVRIREEVDPDLEMAAIHLRVHENEGPALLFENVKGSKYRAVSNLFGTLNRSRFIFRHTLDDIQKLVQLRNNPMEALKKPWKHTGLVGTAWSALPKKTGFPANLFEKVRIQDLPLIRHWPKDGGAFVTLPQVYTEDPDKPGITHANLGMYRIQLNGNEYTLNEEIGLHYQLHRGIGVHQTKANKRGEPLKVSVFVGGPPAHSVAAVMPLPEGLGEAAFAGALSGRRFRYATHEGHVISTDADFIITGEVHPFENKPEGPFGDHLGYYSLQHPFPLMRVHQVYARKNAIWPFTVVGRPPQEDTSFGKLIHEITGDAIPNEIPGLKEVHAVDASGVHPLLLAVGSERYTPYNPAAQPSELLTIANHILGTGQLSLAKFLWITGGDDAPHAHDVEAFFRYMLERIQPTRDIHFHTHTSIDTLDYSGTSLNQGSKVVFAAYGPPVRTLDNRLPEVLGALNARWVMPGVAAIKGLAFTNYTSAAEEMEQLNQLLSPHLEALKHLPLIVIADDPHEVSATLNNFLWITFTRCNPSHDMYGVQPSVEYKHWGCNGPILIDARIKPHHAPVLEKDPEIENRINRFFTGNGPLAGWG
ncbi:MAG TPA: UbiD family decarboxylase [Ferruginibacter sp.]|nr:UbiD family decarboxylase [Ferruginibacter sp.]HRO05384.1 UbiD family decarboxylase [Ferruginibacter sp.]HRO96456.1 UbiD family decarboxylase [Ferruginibacter sp.]HRP48518.1 UbiD family decarboxylase [Ferruginibacter sp.]